MTILKAISNGGCIGRKIKTWSDLKCHVRWCREHGVKYTFCKEDSTLRMFK